MYTQHGVDHSMSILSKSMCACKHFKRNALLYTQHSITASVTLRAIYRRACVRSSIFAPA